MYRLALPAAALALIASAPAAHAKTTLPTVRNKDLPGIETRNPRQHFHTVDDAVIADPAGIRHPQRVRKHYEKFGFVRGRFQVFTIAPHDAAGNSLTMQYRSAQEALAATKHDAYTGPGKVVTVGKLPHGFISSRRGSPGTVHKELFFVRGTVEFRISYHAPKNYPPGAAFLIAEGQKLLKRLHG